jgi:ribokinase
MRRGPPSSIVVVGSINMDLVMRVPRMPVVGESVAGQDFVCVPGGKGGNQAVAAARMGAQVTMIGCLGVDENGERLRASLETEGINCEGLLTAPDVPSGVAMVIVDAGSQNAIVTVAGSNGRVSAELVATRIAALADARLVICQMDIPYPTVEFTLFTAKGLGVPTLLNPSPVAGPLPPSWYAAVDYLVVNELEAAMLSGFPVDSVSRAKEAAEALHRHGARHVLITLGAKGVLAMFTNDGSHHCELYPAARVSAVDTTGAGDTFVGAFAAALANECSHASAVAFAQAAASISVTRLGAQPSIPYLHELQS